MEVQKIEHNAGSPIGQRGAQPFRRPQPAPAPQPEERERPISRTYQAEQGYGYKPEGGERPPADPRGAEEQRRAAEAVNPEPAGEGAPAPDEPQYRPDEWAQRYAQIQRRERQVHMRDQEMKRREQALAEREARVRGFEETLELKEKDPKAFIEKNGLSYSALTDVYLNDGKPTPEQQIQQLQARIDSLIESQKQEKEDEGTKAAQAKIEGFKRNIQGVIEQTEGERFELIKAQKAHGLVFDVIQNYFAETGEMLPVSEAADFVENELYTEAQGLLGLSKFKPKQPANQPEPSPAPEASHIPPEPQRNPPRQTKSHVPGRSETVVRDSGGGINNLSYANQSKREAARMFRFNK